MDYAEVERAVLDRFRRGGTVEEPFPHLFLTEVFPAALYARMRALLPDDALYGATDPRRSRNPRAVHRSKFSIDPDSVTRLDPERRALWTGIGRLLTGQAFLDTVAAAFRHGVAARYGDGPLDLVAGLELNLDHAGYAIGPHTDASQKFATLLFYLPEDDARADLGTAIFLPRRRGFRSESPQQFPFGHFEKLRGFPFLPNSVFGFLKTDASFHGREEVTGPTVRRQFMTLSIQHRSGVPPLRAGAAALAGTGAAEGPSLAR